MAKTKPTPEQGGITVVKYDRGYRTQIHIGNQYFFVSDIISKKHAIWTKQMFEKALRNLFYGELQRYEIFKKINHDFEGETVEIIIEKYLK